MKGTITILSMFASNKKEYFAFVVGVNSSIIVIANLVAAVNTLK